MMGELLYVRHPVRIRIFWAIVYILIIATIVFGMYKVAARIRTHTLPVGQVQLTIPYSKYLVGEAVSFTLKNNYNSPMYVINNCPREPLAVYRQQDGRWVRQHDQASISDCPTEQRQVSVPANGIISGSFAPWHNLFSQPGRYRVVAFVEFYNALPYQEFEVVAPPRLQTAPASPGSSSEQESQSTAPGQAQTPYTAKQSQTITVPGRGTITVQYDTVNIYVTSIAPAAGCTYEGGNSGQQVQVTFKCAGGETQVQLNIVNGQLVRNIESGD